MQSSPFYLDACGALEKQYDFQCAWKKVLCHWNKNFCVNLSKVEIPKVNLYCQKQEKG